jgi:hypothetical protein
MAARLCVADQAAIVRHEGGALDLAANWGVPAEYETHMNEIAQFQSAPMHNPSHIGRFLNDVPTHSRHSHCSWLS